MQSYEKILAACQDSFVSPLERGMSQVSTCFVERGFISPTNHSTIPPIHAWWYKVAIFMLFFFLSHPHFLSAKKHLFHAATFY